MRVVRAASVEASLAAAPTVASAQATTTSTAAPTTTGRRNRRPWRKADAVASNGRFSGPRRRRKSFVGVAALLALASVAGVLGATSPVSACSLASPLPTEEEHLARADLVFEGLAVSSRDPNAGAPIISTGDPIFWTFLVEREIKGSTGMQQEVGTARGSATCGFSFQVGVRYRVFADARNGAFMTSLGSGTRQVSDPPQTTTTTTTRPLAATTTVPTAGPGQPSTGRPLALTG